jgi:EPS-associated MarR family transcriptional regulator
VKSLIDVGLIKLDNFQRSNNKLGYAYLLTPKGIAEKASITVRFLARKQDEYKRLEREIEALKSEVDAEINRARTR